MIIGLSMAISPQIEHYLFQKVSPDTAYELCESPRPFEKDTADMTALSLLVVQQCLMAQYILNQTAAPLSNDQVTMLYNSQFGLSNGLVFVHGFWCL